jgi:hypothetical protein
MRALPSRSAHQTSASDTKPLDSWSAKIARALSECFELASNMKGSRARQRIGAVELAFMDVTARIS